MALNKTLKRLVVTSVARLRSGVKARFGDRGGDEISVRLDTSRTPSELVFYDENNDSDILRLQIGENIKSELQSGGIHELDLSGLSGDLADEQDPVNHAGEHSDGGTDELDAADLAGSKGNDGQVLQTDGSATTWSSAAGVGADDVLAWEYIMSG